MFVTEPIMYSTQGTDPGYVAECKKATEIILSVD